VSGLALFHLINNWLWRRTNVVVFQFDRMFHQVTSLAYDHIFSDGLNLQSLFSALTWSDYYPPLVHLAAVIFYRIFGVSMDVAALSNSVFMLLLIVAVFSIGERLGGPWLGLLSAFIVTTFPIVFSMSRYLYLDFALTAMVALTICLLLRSGGFQRKALALLFGLSLGLGLLTKWTFIAFTAVPILLVLVRSGAIRAAWRALYPHRWNGRRLLFSALLGLASCALWFGPNMRATADLPLGYALLPIQWLLWSFTWHFALTPSEQGANALASLGTGASIAALWYLARIDFVGTFWLNAYGKGTGRDWGFLPYLDFLWREQLSPLYALLLLAAIAGLLWRRWRQAQSWREIMSLGLDRCVLVAWAVVPYIVFSAQASIIHSRYIMPLLPPLGLAIASWLWGIRHRWVRGLLTGFVVVLALFQFSVLSFDAVGPIQTRIPLFAQGLSIQLPATDRTDPRYWVAPAILDSIEAARDTDPARLGVLVNSPRVNSKHFIYLVYTDYPHVQVDELATIGHSQPAYPRLFESDFVLVVDPAPSYARRPDTVATTERILNNPDDTFHRVFQVAETYPLPNDTRLILYERRYPPVQETDLAYHQALMEDLQGLAQPDDALVVLPAEQVYALARFGDDVLPIYPLPELGHTISQADLQTLEALGTTHDRIWLVQGDAQELDPSGTMGRWLARNTYRAANTWYGPLQLMLYAPAAAYTQSPPLHPGEVTWQDGIALQAYRFAEQQLPLGGIISLDLRWQASEPVAQRYKVFVHLLDEDGNLVAQRDTEPLSGELPTTVWTPGEPVEDRLGLWLPPDLPPGQYFLIAGFYPTDGGDRIPVCCPQGDFVHLAIVHVDGSNAQISVE
jgi:4-amino-4-deoxy-L-arabinose transferase-like glycosyltransferase